jgi:Tfp pilus assembly protein FimT
MIACKKGVSLLEVLIVMGLMSLVLFTGAALTSMTTRGDRAATTIDTANSAWFTMRNTMAQSLAQVKVGQFSLSNTYAKVGSAIQLIASAAPTENLTMSRSANDALRGTSFLDSKIPASAESIVVNKDTFTLYTNRLEQGHILTQILLSRCMSNEIADLAPNGSSIDSAVPAASALYLLLGSFKYPFIKISPQNKKYIDCCDGNLSNCANDKTIKMVPKFYVIRLKDYITYAVQEMPEIGEIKAVWGAGFNLIFDSVRADAYQLQMFTIENSCLKSANINNECILLSPKILAAEASGYETKYSAYADKWFRLQAQTWTGHLSKSMDASGLMRF